MKKKDFRLMHNLCMRALKSTASKIMLGAIIGASVGYAYRDYSGVRDYEAACLFSDIIRSTMDLDDDAGLALGSEMEEIYGEWTQDIDLGVYNFKRLRKKDLDNYVWCY